MRVLLAAASHEVQHVGSLTSFYTIETRAGDERTIEWRTRGDMARDKFASHLLESEKYGPDDCILMLDADQRHPQDMLERLRTSMETHNLDMVCAHYYRRETQPIQSLCYTLTGDGTWPFLPMLDPPMSGLHEIAVTGFGAVLIRKKVMMAVKDAIPPGMSPVAIGPIPELEKDHQNWGADFRFFHHARKAGYRLWLDASIESLHAVPLWLGHKSAKKLINYGKWANGAQDIFTRRLELHGVNIEAVKQRLVILEARKRGFEQEYADAVQADAKRERLEKLTIAIFNMEGRIMECGAWLEWMQKYPQIERPDQLPTTRNTPKMQGLEELVGTETERQAEYRESVVSNLRDAVAVIGDNGNQPGQ